MKWEYNDLSEKETFRTFHPIMKVMFTFFWNMKRPVYIDSLEKCKQYFLLPTPFLLKLPDR